ncbi:hypothetical protein [Maribacter sp. 2210JD10-5]|uniref:hypothetical protein n=1 Tax=Maribacter sp. 2210JD10-5 TaxID=3386272 RepID=UPI0039BC5A0D
MGFKVPKDTSPMERELIYLLTDLCVKWGFCISTDNFEQISKKDYYNDNDFAMDVVESEGMDGYSSWINRISEKFRERFGTYQIDSSTFVDRVRDIKETW